MARVLTTDRGDAGRRLDLVLRRHLTELSGASRSRVQRWIAEGRVTVNGRTVSRPAARVALGDAIAVADAGLTAKRRVEPEDIPLSILYEDDELVVLDKPAGLVVHPAYRHLSGTLLNGLLWHARDWPRPRRPSIVGRLDRLTSGLVLVAKSRAVHSALQRILPLPQSLKLYLAVVHGRVSPIRGEIDLGLARQAGDRRRVAVSQMGSPSRTRYVLLSSGRGLSLVRCQLITGRLHQIRVHLAARGWPIVGDPVYGRSDPALAFPRQALHAWRVAFDHPATGRRVEVEAPLPADIQALLSAAHLRVPS